MAEEVKLLRTWSSAFALRVVWALKIKGIEYETILEDLSNKSPLLLQHNPVHKKVPVLLHNGKAICESLVILEYIDETWKENPLLPQDPYEKAMARFWANFGDDKLWPSFRSVFVALEEEQEEAITRALENLELIEEQLKEKKFFHGESIGYLDLALGWMAETLSISEEILAIKLVYPERFPLFSAWMQNFYHDPVIQEFWSPRDKVIALYKTMREKYMSAAAPN